MRRNRSVAVGAFLLVLAMVVGACGDSGGGNGDSAGSGGEEESKGSITVGSADFGEQLLLGNMYALVLEKAGYEVERKLNLGPREIIQPALEKGDVDVVPEYAATLLEFLNKGAGEASGDVDATVEKLRTRLDAVGQTALEPSEATDKNVFAMTKKKAQELGVTKLSDLSGKAGQLVLGGPPECPNRPFCAPGLEKTYGLTFKSFRPLDVGGPVTKEALEKGDVDVALLFSSDPAIEIRNFLVLEDDKQLQAADNIIPVLRKGAIDDEGETALNELSQTLTTEDLIALNKRVDIDKEDPEDVAREYLEEKGLL